MARRAPAPSVIPRVDRPSSIVGQNDASSSARPRVLVGSGSRWGAGVRPTVGASGRGGEGLSKPGPCPSAGSDPLGGPRSPRRRVSGTTDLSVFPRPPVCPPGSLRSPARARLPYSACAAPLRVRQRCRRRSLRAAWPRVNPLIHDRPGARRIVDKTGRRQRVVDTAPEISRWSGRGPGGPCCAVRPP
jgi:hypothetical protein